MILTEPLDERQIQELHSNYHELEETAAALRKKLRAYKRVVRKLRRIHDDLMDADQGDGYPLEGSVWAISLLLKLLEEEKTNGD